MLVKLESAGCVLDTKELVVYPMYQNGSVDIENPVELSECTEEWYSALEEEDRMTVAVAEMIR